MSFSKIIIGLTLLLILGSGVAVAGVNSPYKAILTCGFSGSHMNILACFSDTDLKFTKNGKAGVYKIYNISQVGQEYSDGFHINLSEEFKIFAQNSQGNLVLGITVYNASGKQVYQDEVGKWGVINVGN